MCLRSVLILIVLLSSFPGKGKDSTRTTSTPRKVQVLPVPTFGYAPETRGYAGAVALFTFRIYPDSLTRFSTAKIEGSYTQNRQYIGQLSWTGFAQHNAYLTEGRIDFRRFPELFYGIGNQTPPSFEELYDSKRIDVDVRFLAKIKSHWFAGIGYRYFTMYDIESIAGGIIDAGGIRGATGSTVSGLGYGLRYDSRENRLNPAGGTAFLSVSHTFFQPALGSGYQFTALELDARYYIGLHPAHTIAVQTFQQYNPGAPPFPMMALLGSSSHMRGYYQGRFRDKHYVSLQAEYRWNFYKRWGLTLFGGAGEVAPQISAFSLPGLHYAAGGGLRFKIDRKENVNIRVDYAVGKGSNGVYVVFGEAF